MLRWGTSDSTRVHRSTAVYNGLRLHQFYVATENEGGVHRRQTSDKKIYVSVNIFPCKFEAFSGKVFQYFVFNLNTCERNFSHVGVSMKNVVQRFIFFFFFADPFGVTIFHGDSENF